MCREGPVVGGMCPKDFTVAKGCGQRQTQTLYNEKVELEVVATLKTYCLLGWVTVGWFGRRVSVCLWNGWNLENRMSNKV